MADDIVFKIRAEGTDKFVKDLKKAGVVVEDTGETVEKENKKMSGSFASLGKTIGAAFSVAAIIQFTKILGKAAIDIDATNAKIQTVFGESTKEVDRFARATATSLGLTVNEYKRAAAAIGDLLIPIGFQRKEAAKLSTDLVKLSGALSAWTGGQLSATEVSEILTKALLGEREQLKQLGIQISEADVKARLLEKGQKNLTGSTLAQAKATATLELITEKSADAQAAANDNVTTLAEAQQELSAATRQLRDDLAEGLIPALAETFKTINNGLDFVQRLGISFRTLVQSNLALGAANVALNKAQKAANDAIAEALELTDQQLERRQQEFLLLEKIGGLTNRQAIELAAINDEIERRNALDGGEDVVGQQVRSLKFLNEELKKQQKIINESEPFSEEFNAAALAANKLAKEIRGIKDALKELEKIRVDAGQAGDIPSIVEAVVFGGLPSGQLFVSTLATEIVEDAQAAVDASRKKFATETRQAEIKEAAAVASERIAITASFAQEGFKFFEGLQDRRLQVLQEKLDQGVISEKQYEQEVAEVRRKQAVQDKLQAIFGVTISTAEGIARTIANVGLPAAFPLIGIAAGIFAAQLAAVAAQPIPQFAEGTKGRKKAPRGWAWVGEEGPELMQMKGGEKIVTNQDSDELMRLLGGYGIPVQFNTLEKSLYKPMTKMEALVSNSSTPVDINPLIRSNDMNRFSLGKKLDRIHEAIVSTSTRKMTRA